MNWWIPAVTALAALGASAQQPAFNVDSSVNPCTNFYRHACGVWLKSNPVPADQPSWARFSELQERNNEILHGILEKAAPENPARSAVEKQIGDYYAGCMDEAAIERNSLATLQAELARIAALPNKQAVTDELIHLNKIGVHPFFYFGSEPDAKNAGMMIGGIDQGGLALPDRDYYLKTDENSAKLRQQYVEHVQHMYGLLGDTPEKAAAKAAVILRIETDLAKGSLDLVSRRDPNKVYHKYTVAELISLAPGIDWNKFFGGLGAQNMATLDVSIPPFMRQVESVIVLNSLDDLKLYLGWNLLHDAAPMMPSAFVNENFAFFGKTLSGARELRVRWKRCVSSVDRQLGDAVGQKYVDLTFGGEGKQRTLAMVKAIEQAMESDIKSLDWMSGATKDQALTKLHGIVNKIGFPDKWKDYSSAGIKRDDALGNLFRMGEWHSRDELAKIGKPVDKTEWQMSPPTVNAYYNPQTNDINFPAGILQPPFYDNKLDDATNYGAIGAVIGHELTHGFDDQGRQFDAKGNLRDWWTPEDGKRFEQRASCLEKEYSTFTAVGDLKVNGQLTLGENTADNGGIRLALMALLTHPQKTIGGRTPEQRFFLGYGQMWCENATDEALRLQTLTDPHSPAEFRVNGVLANMPEFQKAFACKPSDPMVSAKACRVW
jgi:endothelin-converting enzyme/putative endopeptidase